MYPLFTSGVLFPHMVCIVWITDYCGGTAFTLAFFRLLQGAGFAAMRHGGVGRCKARGKEEERRR